jgi:hypothetical protein
MKVSRVACVAALCACLAACGGHKPLSAVAAVEAKCHPAHILYPHEQNEPPGRAGVVWQTAAQVKQDDSDGWVAQLRTDGGGFVVLNCRAQGEGHG